MKSKIPKAYKEEKKDIFNKRFGVIFNGEDNLKPLITENAIELSPTASQCAGMFESFLGGGGFEFASDDINLSSDFWEFLSINDLLMDVCRDSSKQSGAFINVGYNAAFEKEYHKVIPNRLCRLGKKDSDGFSGKIVVDPNGWGRSLKKDEVDVYDTYNPNPDIIQQQVESAGGWHNYKGQILFFKLDKQYTYPIPLIEGALNFAEVEYKMGLYYKGTVDRSFEDITFIQHKEFPKKEDEDQFYKNIKELSGVENASSKLIIQDDWNDDSQKQSKFKFNTIKNEYPELGGKYEVMHHTQFLKTLLEEGRLTIEGGKYKGKRITFHDPCYLGRANNVYEAPRELIQKLEAELVEMKNCRRNGLCCGAGGAQMFKDAEKGDKEVNVERTEQALDVKPEIIAAGCPFCNTMMTDGVKAKEKENDVEVMDIAELIANAQDL